MTERAMLLVIAAGLLAAGVANWRDTVRAPVQPAPAAARPAAATAGEVADRREAPVARALPATEAAAENLLRSRFAASSLRGTQPDGALHFDATGGLVLDAGLRRIFDYWLSLDGEFAPAEIRALLQADIAARHGRAAAQAVLAAFDRYVGLLSQLEAYPPAGDTAQRLAALRTARRQWFGDDADALFGAEEAQVEYTLQRQRIESDATLSGAERTARLAALDAARPASERRSQRDATAAHLAEEQTRQLDAAAADPATRHAERRDLWGAAAADRLAALDAERARWDARLAAFARERERLLADPRLDAAARTRALDETLRRDFEETERARVEAMLRTGTLPPGG